MPDVIDLDIATPRWSLPLLAPSRYKGGKGGRSSGKSHFFAELCIEKHVENPNFNTVCIREVQKSMKFSIKKLLENKIKSLGVRHLFKITNNEIKDRRGDGIIIFQGMQDHTADSIKSLEDFDLALCEEAQSLSKRSLELLIPTIRKDGSELWFVWNPDQPEDAIDQLLVKTPPEDSIVVHVNFLENPFCPEIIKKEAKEHLIRDSETYDHIWLGGYNTKSDDQVLIGKWRVDEFTPKKEWSRYYGNDWGFSVDPATLIEMFVDEKTDTLYIYREAYKVGVEIEDTAEFFGQIDGAEKYVIRSDNARPELISYTKRNGYPKIQAAEKWAGSVEDGISKLRSFKEIVIHAQCENTTREARLWKYKRDKKSGDVLPTLIDKHNHCWDAIRYAIEPLTKTKAMGFFDL